MKIDKCTYNTIPPRKGIIGKPSVEPRRFISKHTGMPLKNCKIVTIPATVPT